MKMVREQLQMLTEPMYYILTTLRKREYNHLQIMIADERKYLEM